MCDLFIPEDGCTTITISWLHDVEILVVYAEETFNDLVHINELEDAFSDVSWEHNNGTAISLERGGVPYFIVLFSVAAVRVVIHECVHLVDFIFLDRGIPITADNTEARAYMIDHLCMRIFHILEIDLPEPFTLDRTQWVERTPGIMGSIAGTKLRKAIAEMPPGYVVVGNEL